MKQQERLKIANQRKRNHLGERIARLSAELQDAREQLAACPPFEHDFSEVKELEPCRAKTTKGELCSKFGFDRYDGLCPDHWLRDVGHTYKRAGGLTYWCPKCDKHFDYNTVHGRYESQGVKMTEKCPAKVAPPS